MFTSSKLICTLFYHVDMSDLVKREITELTRMAATISLGLSLGIQQRII